MGCCGMRGSVVTSVDLVASLLGVSLEVRTACTLRIMLHYGAVGVVATRLQQNAGIFAATT